MIEYVKTDKGERAMKRQWTAALLALLLATTLLPGTAWASDAGQAAGSRLTEVDRTVYEILRAEVVKIANGSRSGTAIAIPDQPALSWSLWEMGLHEPGQQDVLDKLEQQFANSLHLGQIYDCLTADLPYEMYWADNQFSWGYSFAQNGARAEVRNLVVYLQAAQAYRGSETTSVSARKVSAARQAAENAKAVVDKYQNLSDYDKLTAYRDEVCRLVSYEFSAADGGTPYGDPWQLVHVFDGDPDTNVVCEGYAKAFKYLCDLSSFDADIACFTVSGTMDGGRHMWNVLRMEDGRYYLADVTNSDSGMIGEEGGLFLSGAAGSDGGRTWTVSKGRCSMAYTYSEGQKDLFIDGYLPLSGTDYPDVSPAIPTSFQPQVFDDVPSWQYYAQPVAWAVEEGITNGTSNGAFSPDRPCSRAEILTFLWRAAGKPQSGLQTSGGGKADFFHAAAIWAEEKGIIDSSADLSVLCTRGEAVDYIWQAFGSPSAQGKSFDDVPIGSPHAEAVSWAAERGVAGGTSPNAFQPELVCSRGQIVTFLHRACHGKTPFLSEEGSFSCFRIAGHVQDELGTPLHSNQT